MHRNEQRHRRKVFPLFPCVFHFILFHVLVFVCKLKSHKNTKDLLLDSIMTKQKQKKRLEQDWYLFLFVILFWYIHICLFVSCILLNSLFGMPWNQSFDIHCQHWEYSFITVFNIAIVFTIYTAAIHYFQSFFIMIGKHHDYGVLLDLLTEMTRSFFCAILFVLYT